MIKSWRYERRSTEIYTLSSRIICPKRRERFLLHFLLGMCCLIRIDDVEEMARSYPRTGHSSNHRNIPRPENCRAELNFQYSQKREGQFAAKTPKNTKLN